MNSTVPPLPVSIVGGYLGAGKTTLVNRLLRAKGFVRDHQGRLRTLHVVGERFEVTDAPSSAAEALTVIGLRARLDKEAIAGRLAEVLPESWEPCTNGR